MKFRVIKDPSF